MKKIKHSNFGFTLLELIIIMVIVVFLTTVSIIATSQVIKDLRFTNIFNKIVFIVQNGRNLAATGKNGAITIVRYGIEFNTAISPRKINLFSIDINNKKEYLDTQIIEDTIGLQCEITTVNSQLCANGLIQFINGNAQTELFCGGNAVSFLNVKLSDVSRSRTKNFSIQQVSGIPQVQ